MEEREKRYVPVIVRFEADGKLRPLEIEFDEAHRYPVDKILDVRRAACQSVGGVGDRYTCRIQGKESYLWFEKGRWFVAAKRKQKARQHRTNLCRPISLLFYLLFQSIKFRSREEFSQRNIQSIT